MSNWWCFAYLVNTDDYQIQSILNRGYINKSFYAFKKLFPSSLAGITSYGINTYILYILLYNPSQSQNNLTSMGRFYKDFKEQVNTSSTIDTLKDSTDKPDMQDTLGIVQLVKEEDFDTIQNLLISPDIYTIGRYNQKLYYKIQKKIDKVDLHTDTVIMYADRGLDITDKNLRSIIDFINSIILDLDLSYKLTGCFLLKTKTCYNFILSFTTQQPENINTLLHYIETLSTSLYGKAFTFKITEKGQFYKLTHTDSETFKKGLLDLTKSNISLYFIDLN